MKRIQLVSGLVLILILLAATGRMALADTAPQDIPPAHPAYQAVKMLLDKGYLQLYQDQTFQGDQPVDRYTLARIVARILDDIASGQVGANKNDVALLRSLTNEFRDELVELSSKGGLFNKRLEDLTRQDQVFKEDLTKTGASVQVISSEQVELQNETRQMIASIQELQQQTGNLAEQNTALQAALDQTKTDVNNTKEALTQTNGTLEQTRNDLADTKNQLAQTVTTLDQTKIGLQNTRGELAATNRNLNSLSANLGQTKSDLDQTKNELAQTKTNLNQALTELSQAKADLTESKDNFRRAQNELTKAKAELAQTKTELNQMSSGLEQAKSENDILRIKQQNQQKYIIGAFVLGLIGIIL